MWVRGLLTPGQWSVYTALWSYPTDSVFPSHQDLADRAWCERGTAADAVATFDELGLLEREAVEREDGGQTSNTYFLIEIPTAEHRRLLATKTAERTAEQDAKRKKRKATNRKYEGKKVQVNSGSGEAQQGYGEESTPARKTRGTARKVPRGYGEESTPGGTAEIGPRGYGEDRTHESLGVTPGSSLTVGDTSSSPSAQAPASKSTTTTKPNKTTSKQEKKAESPSDLANQEDFVETAAYVKSAAHWPTLTEPEQALHDEVIAVAPMWQARLVRKVIGSKVIREVAQRDPELVKRAFLIGAADTKTVPMRLWHVAECPHWRKAASDLATERKRQADQQGDSGPSEEPASTSPAPAPRTPSRLGEPWPFPIGSDNPDLAAWKASNAARKATKATAGAQP